MEKKIEDHLHLYLGCETLCESQSGSKEPSLKKLTGISYDDTQKQWWCYFENEEESYLEIEFCKPILRPLSDITDKEVSYCETAMWGGFVDAMTNDKDEFLKSFIDCTSEYRPGFTIYVKAINWFRINGFDIDGLIESGLAIDKTKHQQ